MHTAVSCDSPWRMGGWFSHSWLLQTFQGICCSNGTVGFFCLDSTLSQVTLKRAHQPKKESGKAMHCGKLGLWVWFSLVFTSSSRSNPRQTEQVLRHSLGPLSMQGEGWFFSSVTLHPLECFLQASSPQLPPTTHPSPPHDCGVTGGLL